MKAFRKIIFWLHLVLGIVGGVVILIMCVTGAALSFEKNILAMVENDQRRVPVRETQLPPSILLAKVLEAKPKARPTSLVSQNDPAAAVTVSLGREGSVFVDPYTGAITGEGSKQTRAFFGFMTDLHRWLVMSGDDRWIGKAITGACNLMFLGLAITGIYIWFPRNISWKTLRPRTWFRANSTAKARELNWHTTIGFWSSLVLIILTVTAAVISYQWAGNMVYTLTGNEVPKQSPPEQNASQNPPPPFTVPANLDSLWSAAASQSPGWKSISLRLPLTKEASFTIDEGKDWNIFGRASLTLDAANASVIKWEPYAEKNSASQIRTWMRFTHTGESFGIVGQIVGFIACICGAFLVYTGFALAFRRLGAYIRRRSNADQAATGDANRNLPILNS